jgi:succinate dehydrogenase/fumarate reductase flavoprotein subunit
MQDGDHAPVDFGVVAPRLAGTFKLGLAILPDERPSAAELFEEINSALEDELGREGAAAVRETLKQTRAEDVGQVSRELAELRRLIADCQRKNVELEAQVADLRVVREELAQVRRDLRALTAGREITIAGLREENEALSRRLIKKSNKMRGKIETLRAEKDADLARLESRRYADEQW